MIEDTIEAKVKYPKHREELLLLQSIDQAEIRQNSHRIGLIKSKEKRDREYAQLARNAHMRAQRMLSILEEIEEPSFDAIGRDGCEALLLITQHSYLEIMKYVYKKVKRLADQRPGNVSMDFVPALVDRIRILEGKKQIYGTQWTVDSDNTPFLIAVEDFDGVNILRARFGLGPMKRPVNLAVGAVKYPLGRGLARASDQRVLNAEEYARYARFYLRPEV